MARHRKHLFGAAYLNAATRAAVAGLGVALVPACLVEDELSSGRLKALLPESPRNRLVFYVAVPDSKQAQPAIRAFVDWIVRAAASAAPSSQGRSTRLRRSS